MSYYNLIPIARSASKLGVATYQHKGELPAGSIVRIQYGSRNTVGIVVGKSPKPKFKTKPIAGLVSEQPLPSSLLNLTRMMQDFYPFDAPSIYSLLVPNGAHKQRRGSYEYIVGKPNDPHPKLTPQQQAAVNALPQDVSDSQSWLLHGVTGSGKTRVYFEQAKRTLKQGRSVILLVPEIALSSQLISRAQEHFSAPIYQMHSHMTESEAHKAWQSMLEQKEPSIVVGPRSALFAPVRNLGLIIIDEAHDQSYKQDQNPHYYALHVAAMRAKCSKAQLVMGTATPNVTEYLFSEAGNVNRIELPNTIFKQKNHSKHVVDIRDKTLFSRSKLFSNLLLDSIHESLANNKQTLLYVNRRGHAPIVICSECDWRSVCDSCSLPLVFHSSDQTLRCHVCNTKSAPPSQCPQCHSAAIRYRGAGTQKLESEISKLFPEASVARLDHDSHSKSTTPQLIRDMESGKTDILVGTQMITKGFDFRSLATVGIVNADSMLYLPDYRSSERAFQVIYQAIGRNDRTGSGGTTIVQTSNPTHPAIVYGVKEDYQSFYKSEIETRKEAGFPPYSYILKITARRKSAQAASRALRSVIELAPDNLRVLGPAPALHEIQANKHVWGVALLSRKRSQLVSFARSLSDKSLSVDVDPLDLL